jgi:hypothetical protein
MKKYIKSVWGFYIITTLVLVILWGLNNHSMNVISFFNDTCIILILFTLFISFVSIFLNTKFENLKLNNIFIKGGIVLGIGVGLLLVLSLLS